MANEEHVAILKQGVDVWNKWREENPDVRPYLFGAMLYEADLTGVNFNRADLSGAILSKANLSNADISDASLKFAQIGYANLKRANLQDTDCTFAYLVNTDLSEANLSSANFFAAALDGANFKLTKLLMTNLVNAGVKETNFSKAQFGRTNLGHLDLSEARGLESSVHQGRSILGIRSLDYSQGKLPDMFLRGIGWSDAEIEFILPLYKDRVFESYSGFISYSSKDEEFAQRLYNDLQAAGVRVWFAPEDLKIGDEFAKKINQEIRLRDKLILVLSENSVNSDWVAFEVEQAYKEEEERNTGNEADGSPMENPVLFPITIDDAVFDCDEPWARKIKRRRHIGDLRGWKDHDMYQKGLERLLRDLKGA